MRVIYLTAVLITAIIGVKIIGVAHGVANSYQERLNERCAQVNEVLPGSCTH
jgi:hypothetical protein